MNRASSDFSLHSRIECIQMSWVLVHQVPGNHCGTRFHNVDSYAGLCHSSQYLTAQVPHGVVSASIVPFPFILYLLDCFCPQLWTLLLDFSSSLSVLVSVFHRTCSVYLRAFLYSEPVISSATCDLPFLCSVR